jgi:hypothetical protein
MDFRSGRPRSRHADRRTPALAVIRWKHADGTEAEGHPLPLEHAEALLRAFEEQFPVPTFWLEVPPVLADEASDT